MFDNYRPADQKIEDIKYFGKPLLGSTLRASIDSKTDNNPFQYFSSALANTLPKISKETSHKMNKTYLNNHDTMSFTNHELAFKS